MAISIEALTKEINIRLFNENNKCTCIHFFKCNNAYYNNFTAYKIGPIWQYKRIRCFQHFLDGFIWQCEVSTMGLPNLKAFHRRVYIYCAFGRLKIPSKLIAFKLYIYSLCEFKGVMNWEIKISLSFWDLRGQHIIRISCKFQNWKCP